MYPEWNSYNYVMQNPVQYTDSTGMCPDDDPGCQQKARESYEYTASDGITYIADGFGSW